LRQGSPNALKLAGSAVAMLSVFLLVTAAIAVIHILAIGLLTLN
jgi:hypothetical protein